MTGLPQDLPIVERDVVRLVVRDTLDRILLFRTQEITAPELGRWWELPGGGIETGETYRQTAVRELREEAGITVSEEQVAVPTWTRDGSFRHRTVRHLQHEVVVEVRLAGPGPRIDDRDRLDYEKVDYLDFRWWPIPEVVASTGQFSPSSASRRLRPTGWHPGSARCSRGGTAVLDLLGLCRRAGRGQRLSGRDR